MYKILLRLKKMYKYEQWMKMVEQAKERGKITDEEYKQLTTPDETESDD